jgi:hypothetical protein
MVPKVMFGRPVPTPFTPPTPAPSRAEKPAAPRPAGSGGPGPVAYGTVVFIDRRSLKNAGSVRIRVAAITDLRKGGRPKLFQLFAEGVGTSIPARPLGTVMLQRVSDRDVIAVAVDESGADFAEKSPDFHGPVEIEVRDGDVWVRFPKRPHGKQKNRPV